MQANFEDYNIVLFKFIEFIKSNELIYKYIRECGECDQDLDNEFVKISSSYGRKIFYLGSLDEEEIRNVFAILSYIVENDISVHGGVDFGYSISGKFPDKLKGFNDSVALVLIRHIESFLTKIGIDMGIDEKVTYSITVENGQVNIANDSSTITATNTVSAIDYDELLRLTNEVKKESKGISPEDYEILISSIDVIKEEVKSTKPRKSFIKTAILGLKGLKNTVEFTAAIAALAQFIQPFI